MKNWVVLYLVPNDILPRSFVCSVKKSNQAEKQCLKEDPNREVVWTFQGTVEEAFDDYWHGQ